MKVRGLHTQSHSCLYAKLELCPDSSILVDPYEDYPEDDDHDISSSPETAVRIATELKELGNKKFKEGNTEAALSKWESE